LPIRRALYGGGIDVSVLRYLTDQDLEKIGVVLGHPTATQATERREKTLWA
jgi:hypothetical protein